MPGPLRTRCFADIAVVPDDLWRAAAPPDFFFSKAFLQVMQHAEVEDARFRHLVLLEGDEPVGAAVLSTFEVGLDLLSGDDWVKRLRRVVPFLLDHRIVFCGIPASFAQHHLHVARPELRGAAVAAVHRAMEAWADELGSGVLLWKEWSEDQGIRDEVLGHGYVALPTLPRHFLSDLPDTVEAFTGLMRSSYRRKYRTASRLLDGDGPVWEAEGLRLEVGPFTHEHADAFFRGYMALMERTKVRVETYPPQFFHGLADSDLDTRVMRLTNTANGELLDALLVTGGDTLSFALVAKDHDTYEDALYATLLRCIVLFAIREGFRTVRLGQTSSYAKCSIGATPLRMEIYVRMRRRALHLLLERFGSRLFPGGEELPQLSVFREGTERARAIEAAVAGAARPG